MHQDWKYTNCNSKKKQQLRQAVQQTSWDHYLITGDEHKRLRSLSDGFCTDMAKIVAIIKVTKDAEHGRVSEKANRFPPSGLTKAPPGRPWLYWCQRLRGKELAEIGDYQNPDEKRTPTLNSLGRHGQERRSTSNAWNFLLQTVHITL